MKRVEASVRVTFVILTIVLLITVIGSHPILACNAVPSEKENYSTPFGALTSSTEGTFCLDENVNGTIAVDRDSIVIDGQGHSIQGFGGGTGIDLSGRYNVTVENVTIRGFVTGIELYRSTNCTVSGCEIADNQFAIHLSVCSNNRICQNNIVRNRERGISGIFATDNLLFENDITENGIYAINLDLGCDGNSIIGNRIFNNSGDGIHIYNSINGKILDNYIEANDNGIFLDMSDRNILRNNMFVDNRFNFKIADYYLNDVDTSNSVNGKPIYYWIGESDRIVPADAGYVALVLCTGIVVRNLTLSHNGQAMFLALTTDSSIINNEVVNNWNGIQLQACSGINIIGNHISHNEWGGIKTTSGTSSIILRNNISMNAQWGLWLDWSSNYTVVENDIVGNKYGTIIYGASNNTIYHNNFIDNLQDVDVEATIFTNMWDDGYPSGGNYWNRQTVIDLFKGPNQDQIESDGIVDVPYSISSLNRDNFPLSRPYVGVAEDLNNDRAVDIYDLILLASAFGSKRGDRMWNLLADLNQDGTIDLFDALKCATAFGWNR